MENSQIRIKENAIVTGKCLMAATKAQSTERRTCKHEMLVLTLAPKEALWLHNYLLAIATRGKQHINR